MYAGRLLTIGLLAGSVSRTGPVPPLPPTFNQHVNPHSVHPAAQPLPTALVRVGSWGSPTPPPPPPDQLQEIIRPRVVRGDPAPFPESVVTRGTRPVIPDPALPTALSQTTYPANQSFVGPFEVGGDFYSAILGVSDTHVVVMKATADPLVDGNWAGQDEVVLLGAAAISLWSVVDGTDIHIVTQEADGRLGYHKFSTSTDTWTIQDEDVGVAAAQAPSNPCCSIAVRSDGDVIVLYAARAAGVDGIDYARREATVWTVDVQVDNGGGVFWFSAVVVKGSSDRMHFFFVDFDASDAYQRTLTSANVLETFPATFDATASATQLIFGQGVSYDDGGTQRVRVPYLDVNDQISIAELDSADVPTVSVTADASDNDSLTDGFSLAIDGKDVHLLYVILAANAVFHDHNDDDLGWGTDENISASVSASALNSNIYDRIGTTLAWIENDNGTVEYHEFSIGKTARSRQVVGDAPLLPEARIRQPAPSGPFVAPPTIAQHVVFLRNVRPVPQPLPDARVLHLVKTPKTVFTFHQGALRPRTVQGDVPPVPVGRVSRPQGLAPVETISHHVVEPRVVDPSAQPLPAGQIVRTEKTPKAVVTFNQLALAPRVVRGDSAGFPDERVLRSQIAEVVTFHQRALAPRVVRGDPAPLPDDRIVRTHKRPAAVADFHQAILSTRVVRGDAAPEPVGRVDHRHKRPAAVATFNQTVLVTSIVRGDAPPEPEGRVLRLHKRPAAEATFQLDLLPTRVVRGDEAPRPEAAVRQVNLHHSGRDDPALPSQFVRGDAAPLPEGFTLRTGHQYQLHPAAPTFQQHVLAPRVVRGDPAGLPEGRVVHGPLAPPVVTFHQRATFVRVVRGDAAPFPTADVRQVKLHHSGRDDPSLPSRLVRGDEPPRPEGAVFKTGHHYQTWPAAPTFQQNVLRPRVVTGDTAPLPAARVLDLRKTPVAEATFNLDLLPTRIVRGDEAPRPEAQVTRTHKRAAAVEDFNQPVLAVRVVRGDAAPQPEGRALHLVKRPAAEVTFHQAILSVRVVRGDAAPFPLADVQQTRLFHSGRDDPSFPSRVVRGDEPPLPEQLVSRRGLFHSGRDDPALPLRVVRGDAAPTPEGFVVRTGHQEQLHPAALTFHQAVLEPTVVRGDAAPLPEGRVLHVRKRPAAEVTFQQNVLQPRRIEGDPAPLPEAQVVRTHKRPAAVETFNQNALRDRVVRGDAPPTPERQVTRSHKVSAEEATFHISVLPTRVVRGDEPDLLPEGRALHVRKQPAAVAVFNQAVLQPRSVGRIEPPPPEGRVLQSRLIGEAAPVATFNQNVLEPRAVQGDPAPRPDQRISRTGHRYQLFPQADVFNQCILMVRSVRGDEEPKAKERILRWGLSHTGFIPIVGSARGFFGRRFLS